MRRVQRKKAKLPARLYLAQREELAAEGKTPSKAADNIKKNPGVSYKEMGKYLDHLIDEYSLRKISKRKPVNDLDDLYHLPYTHWVLDDSVFKDERQRVQLATGLLAAAFFGCRPCSLFDTRVNLTETSTIDSPDGKGSVRSKTDAGDTDIYISQRNRLSGTHSHQDHSVTTDSDSDPCYISDSDSGTDDDYDTGPEETRSFLYRHIRIHIVANLTPGEPNLVFLKAMLLHTKGQDRNPRVKILLIGGGDDDPLFSLLDHLVSLALHDDAFESKYATDVSKMFHTKIPPGKKSLVMKWKSRVLDLPVFREPLRSAGESGTSPSQSLLASTWICYLKQLGRKAGLEHSFIQYGLRRGLLNVVNNNAPASTRDQIFDHRQGAVGYYLGQEIRFDTESCYLRRPSNEVVQRMARLASLTADMTAPTQLNDQQKADLKQYPKVRELVRRNKALTSKIHAAGYRTVQDAAPSKLCEEKKKIEKQLSCVRVKLRNKMTMQARKRHFRNADTQTFDSQFSPSAAATSPEKDDLLLPSYNLSERAGLVQLTCGFSNNASFQNKLHHRIRAIEARVALCQRRETRRARPILTVTPGDPEPMAQESETRLESDFPMICEPTQCLFCLGDPRLPYLQRIHGYAKPNKMMDEVEKHLRKYAPQDILPCPHPQCQAVGLTLPNTVTFKNHAAKEHRIFLCALKTEISPPVRSYDLEYFPLQTLYLFIYSVAIVSWILPSGAQSWPELETWTWISSQELV